MGVIEKTVRHVFAEYVKALQRHLPFETPEWMGVDEIYRIRPRGVITNIATNTVVDLLENRNRNTLIHYFSHLPDRHRIKLVTMDM